MAITRNDCLLLLTNLQDNGINVDNEISSLLKSNSVNLDVIRFINEHRQIDVSCFYEKLRHSYNHKKSNLYINLVKEIEDPNDVLNTLASLQLQILLFSKNVEDKVMFFKHARCDEICAVLTNYFKTQDITNCIKLLRIIKADLKTFESFKKEK